MHPVSCTSILFPKNCFSINIAGCPKKKKKKVGQVFYFFLHYRYLPFYQGSRLCIPSVSYILLIHFTRKLAILKRNVKKFLIYLQIKHRPLPRLRWALSFRKWLMLSHKILFHHDTQWKKWHSTGKKGRSYLVMLLVFLICSSKLDWTLVTQKAQSLASGSPLTETASVVPAASQTCCSTTNPPNAVNGELRMQIQLHSAWTPGVNDILFRVCSAALS